MRKPIKQFQFHNGSIKRFGAHLALKMEAAFQFHNGSIKRTASEWFEVDSRVSIPQWFD